MTGNSLKTYALMAALTAFLVWLGYQLGSSQGAMMAFVMSLGMNLFTYWNADKIVLRTYRAKEVDETTAPDLVRLVAQLAQKANLPMPRVYIVPDAQPNAFATGRNPENAAVAATTGILERLSPQELAGVLAHELAHVKHRDTLIMTVTASLAGGISMLLNMLMFTGGGQGERRHSPLMGLAAMLLAPLAASLVQMAISRSREYEADREGALICGHPEWLADALENLEQSVARLPSPAAEAHPATAHVFIVNPLRPAGFDALFRTHPSTADRVAKLRAMAS